MLPRAALGLAALTAATSCVAPQGYMVAADDASVPPPHAPRHRTPGAAPVLPAGPSLALLAAAPAGAPAVAARNAVSPITAPPFAAAARPEDAERALGCLTAAVYYEARSQSIEGQEAVAQVVLNRVRNPAFPASVCGTVHEGSSRETGCQFTFTCDGSTAARIDHAAWDRARRVAAAALGGFVYAPVGSATYYHTTAVHPWWAPRLAEVAQIGAHIFYRLPGQLGGMLAFGQRYGGSEPAAKPGALFHEKPVVQALEAVAGVIIQRGAAPATDNAAADAVADGDPAGAARPAVTFSSGVRIHRGDTDALPDAPQPTEEAGVHVHVLQGPRGSAAAAT
ncbi:MAG: cell wall hydrolase [Sphingomonas sp.]